MDYPRGGGKFRLVVDRKFKGTRGGQRACGGRTKIVSQD